MSSSFKKLTPVLVMDHLEPALEFWVERLGFTNAGTVEHEGTLGFVMLQKDGVEVMYQSRASVMADLKTSLPEQLSGATGLFFEVTDLESLMRKFRNDEIVVPRRETFYGSIEFGVREPAGLLVLFAEFPQRPVEQGQ